MPKRIFTEEERQRRIAYQRAYRARKSESAEWRANEASRRMVC